MADYYQQFLNRGQFEEPDLIPGAPSQGLLGPVGGPTNLIGPSFDRSYFSTAAVSSRTGQPRGEAAPEEVVAGPLGIYQEDKGRPFEQVGKFGVNLMPQVGTRAPGAPSAYGEPARNPLQETGFFEGLLGGIFGMSGNEGIRGFGNFVGSVFDAPLEAAGNVIGLPGAWASSIPVAGMPFSTDGLDPEIKAMYEESIRENPINSVLMWSHAAKAQWEKDVAEGRMTGLMGDVGPAVAATDQLGLLIQLFLAKPQQVVERWIAGLSPDGPTQSLEKIEAAVRGSVSDSAITNPFYQQLQMRLERGDFGPVGTARSRDLMLDEVAIHNAILRDAGDENQEGIITGQGLADIALSLVTDPLLIGSFGGGLARGALKAGRAMQNAKFLSVFPEASRAGITDELVEAARRIGGFDTPERALVAMNRDVNLNYRAMQEVAQRYPAQAEEAANAATYVQRWAERWEPALRPVIGAVDTLNDPFRLFGKGPSARVADTVFSSNATEGAIRAYGLDSHADLADTLAALPNDVGAKFTRGLGVYVGNLSRVYFRNGLVKDIRRRGGVPFAHTPDELLAARMTGARGSDIATGMEQLNLRVKPLYLATEQGGAEAALSRAREEATARLVLLGATREQATETAAKMTRDQIAELDAAYFGHATDQFISARDAAIKAKPAKPKVGTVDPEDMTILGPRQMTEQVAQDVLDSVARGAVDEVREALRTYDLLFENFSEGLSDPELLRAVRELLEDQIKGKALPRDLDSLKGLPAELRRWAEDNADLGYRPGFRPQEMWRATVVDDKIVGINPWTELAATAADVPTYTRFQRARDMLFHNIRGERILADARIALAQHTTERFGFTRAQSDALFARVIKSASDAGITPRGMSPEQIYTLFTTQKLPREVLNGIGPREAIEAVMLAFEGRLRNVGVTQKFTGGVKTGLGGQGNWVGQLAERIYPTVRFTLNPLFQAQELTEPFILNIMRGIKPGWKASDLDAQTLGLIESLIRDSKYALDDQIERSNVLLWGADAAHQAVGPTTRLGKVVRALSLGGRINVKEVKRVNFARATRRQLGREFEEAMNRVAPELIPALKATYGTSDMGAIAVRYLSEKAAWGEGGRVAQEAIIASTKPATLGARTPVDLDQAAVPFDDIADGRMLQEAVRDGRLDAPTFHDVLAEAGADPDYITRAYTTASSPFTADEWWDEYRVVMAGGNGRATNAARAMVKARAEVMQMGEHEWLARRFADTPMSADARALAALTPTERRSLQFMAEAADATVKRESTDAAIANFQRNTRFADREHFAVIDEDGNILSEGHQVDGWFMRPDGAIIGASLGEEIVPSAGLAKGRILIHNHPSHNPFSPADMTTAAEWGVKEMWIASPGMTHVLRPDPDEGWMTEGFTSLFGDTPDWDEVRRFMTTNWHDTALQFHLNVKGLPFYEGRALQDRWIDMLDHIATSRAVQSLSDRFGWTFDTKVDFSLPTNPDELESLLNDFAHNPPVAYARDFPYAFRAGAIERTEGRAGASVAFEYDSDFRNWVPRGLSDEQQRAIQDGMDEWLRTELAPRFGVLVTDVRRGRGGWINEGVFTDTINSVLDVYGTREQVRSFAAAVGHNLKQWAVFASRPKEGIHNLARYDAGEAWAYSFVAKSPITDDQAVALQRAIAKGSPDIAGWGSSIVRTSDGRIAVRYLNTDRVGAVSSDEFLSSTRAFLGEELNDALDGLDFDVAIHHDVMEWDRPFNDWEAQPNGEAYKGIVAESRPDVAGELESRYAREGQDRLAALLRLHAPNEFADHLDGLRAAGKPIPEFRVPGEFTPAPLADRVAVFIPGGRSSLREADREFTLWEQQILKAQRINPEELFNADPDLYVDLMDAIWRSKVKTSFDTPQQYNAMAWAALTANAPLDVTEGAFALWRANAGTGAGAGFGKGVERLAYRAQRIAQKLPNRWQDDPGALGVAFQMDEGMRFSGMELHRASWLTPEERTALDDIMGRIDRRLREMSDGQREVWARRLQARIDARGRHSNVRLQVHPYPVKTIEDQWVGSMQSFTSISRPGVRLKGSATNTSWGRIMRWLTSGVFTSDSPGVQRFLNQQVGESRTDWALRLSSILPGIDVKTALLAAEGSAPHLATHGAMDTHMIRYVVQRANARGDLQGLLASVSPGYAKHLDEQLRRSMDGKSAFKSPEADRVYLVADAWRSRPWSPEKLAHMRSRLNRIPDPEVRALYDDDEVLRLAAETGGKVNVWGGDYAAIEEYFSTVLRADEVARLRAAGHNRAADRIEAMSGGQWQWLMWDRIRASAGLTLDPHNSLTRSAASLPPRSSLELDRAMEISRSGTPFDPNFSMLLQEEDGRILGANALMADDRRILLATQHADARTGLHELAHAMEPDLDPSQANVILAAFRDITGSKRTTWSREVSEWWADQFLNYVKGGSKVAPGNLRSSFEYFRKTVGGVEATIRARAEREVLEATRKSAIAKATADAAKTAPARAEAERALNAAVRAERSARRELRRARARVDLDTLEQRWNIAKGEVARWGETLKEAKARVRAATAEARAARTRAREAAGTRSAGGLTAAIRRKEEAITRAESEVKAAERALGRAQRQSARHAADVRGARRRTPLKSFEDRVARAQQEAATLGDKARIAREADTVARKAVQDARDLPVRAKKAVVRPADISPEMRTLFDQILNPPEVAVTKTGPGSPVDIGTHYDLQEEAAYEAAHIALSRAEENAFTLHYYKRGRNVIERSINHPYFGLYPASYMWGKVLPEMLRFLVKTPFGIEAPLGGLALANNIYRQVMVQQQYDPEFRQQMIDRTDMFHLMALLTPALPWEVPVNAPLWARRVAEADATHEAELAAGDAESPMMDPEQFGKLTQEMLTYAFGPANTAEMVGSGVNSLFNLGDQTFRAAAQTVQGVLAQGQGMPAPPPLGAPSAPIVDTAP